VRIERALLSVYDKAGVAEFAGRLAALGVEIVSTGGTARLLREAGVRVRDVAELTEWPEMLSGRVKTLHPRLHAGILFRRASAEDRAELARGKIPAIDLVAVNLYPFAATAARPDLVPDELIENIDIGGPAMLRSAAKNFLSVGVVCDPADYSRVAEELESSGELSLPARLELARKAFALTARYDGLIATELERLSADGGVRLGERPRLPERLSFPLERRAPLRYGENPHQRAALYVRAGEPLVGLAAATQLQGKELSYNNLVDLDAAWRLVNEFARPAVAIIKHTNPCGAAEHEQLAEAYRRALACDPVSAYGGVMAFNRPLDRETAAEVAKLFVECVAAPGYQPAAAELLAGKKNLRLLAMPGEPEAATLELKCVFGGLLVQEPDRHTLREQDWKVVTERAPSREERAGLEFGWKVSKHVKSNAIVFARAGELLGVGAGQMSRVDAVKIAAMRALLPLAGSAVASDAFFPFPDGVEEAARAGATAVIQPGGSVRDAEVIAAANRLGLAMVFTGVRHFRH
jgi:phosphoribosylaminoimidazolecarboxamide formyltransferase / IMP cyclohydrolase